MSADLCSPRRHPLPPSQQAGWGKQLSYVLAVGRHGAADVSRRYTRQWEAVAQRRGLVTEPWLGSLLQQATARSLAALPLEERQQAEARAAAEQRELAAGGSGALSAEELALPGRTTGDAGWLAGRGEDGSAVAAQKAQGAAAVPPPGTRYALARDEGLRAAQPRRLCGGAVCASGDNPPGETAARAFEGSPATKWLDFGGPQGQRWLEYRLPAEQPAVVLQEYALTAANDSPERDPRHTVLEAWSEGALLGRRCGREQAVALLCLMSICQAVCSHADLACTSPVLQSVEPGFHWTSSRS